MAGRNHKEATNLEHFYDKRFRTMENTKIIQKPVVDLIATGKNIKKLRHGSGFSVRDLQFIFGFEYPQAIYAWESGKNIPSIDNLLVLAQLFNVNVESIVITNQIEIEVREPLVLMKTA